MGAITRTYERNKVVDFSYPYFFIRVGVITKKPTRIPNIKALLWPYGDIVWICLATSLPLFALIFLTFSKIDKKGFPYNFNLGKAIMQVSQILVMQGIPKWPLTWTSRILLLFWVLFALVMAYGEHITSQH